MLRLLSVGLSQRACPSEHFRDAPNIFVKQAASRGPRVLRTFCAPRPVDGERAGIRTTLREYTKAEATQIHHGIRSSLPVSLIALWPLLQANNAIADFDDVPPTVLFGLSPVETALLFAPVTLYGIFYVYRSTINPQAKLLDFLFIAAASLIVFNIVSIIFFRVRIF